MRKFLFAVILGLTIISLNANIAQAAVFNFSPADPDLGDLAHEYYYTWGINWSIPSGEKITGATLTYYNIYDWTTEYNDRLYTHLLDNPSTGTVSNWDNQNGGDNFSGRGYLVGTWTDNAGGSARNFNLVYDFAALDYWMN